jgi:hypothetical protein
LDPDPDWSPASNAGSGSGSGKNEYGSETLEQRYLQIHFKIGLNLPKKEKKAVSVRKLASTVT